jgi:hypothetical protein
VIRHLVLELLAAGRDEEARELARNLRPWAWDRLAEQARRPRP